MTEDQYKAEVTLRAQVMSGQILRFGSVLFDYGFHQRRGHSTDSAARSLVIATLRALRKSLDYHDDRQDRRRAG